MLKWFNVVVDPRIFKGITWCLIMSPNCCKYFVNSRTPNRKNKRPATPANTATGIFAALIRLMKSELTEIQFELQKMIRLHQCWWQVVGDIVSETIYVKDKFEMLVTDFRCSWPFSNITGGTNNMFEASQKVTNIMILSVTSTNCLHYKITSIKLSPISL